MALLKWKSLPRDKAQIVLITLSLSPCSCRHRRHRFLEKDKKNLKHTKENRGDSKTKVFNWEEEYGGVWKWTKETKTVETLTGHARSHIIPRLCFLSILNTKEHLKKLLHAIIKRRWCFWPTRVLIRWKFWCFSREPFGFYLF